MEHVVARETLDFVAFNDLGGTTLRISCDKHKIQTIRHKI